MTFEQRLGKERADLENALEQGSRQRTPQVPRPWGNGKGLGVFGDYREGNVAERERKEQRRLAGMCVCVCPSVRLFICPPVVIVRLLFLLTL